MRSWNAASVKLCALSVIGLLLFSLNLSAYAANKAATVLSTRGKVIALRDGQNVKLKRRSVIFAQDTIKVAPGAKAQIRFNDGTLVALSSKSVFKVLEYRYKKDAKNNKNLSSLVRGGMRSLTGAISKNNKEAYKIKTPVATIGIRGTDFLAVTSGCSAKADALALTRGCKVQVGVISGAVQVAKKAIGPASGTGNTFASVSGDGSIQVDTIIPNDILSIIDVPTPEEDVIDDIPRSNDHRGDADANNDNRGEGDIGPEEGAPTDFQADNDGGDADIGDDDDLALDIGDDGLGGEDLADIESGIGGGGEFSFEDYNTVGDVLAGNITPVPGEGRFAHVSVQGNVFSDPTPAGAFSGILNYTGILATGETAESPSGILLDDTTGNFNAVFLEDEIDYSNNLDGGAPVSLSGEDGPIAYGEWDTAQMQYNAGNIGCAACASPGGYYVTYEPTPVTDLTLSNLESVQYSTDINGFVAGTTEVTAGSEGIDPVLSSIDVELDLVNYEVKDLSYQITSDTTFETFSCNGNCIDVDAPISNSSYAVFGVTGSGSTSNAGLGTTTHEFAFGVTGQGGEQIAGTFNVSDDGGTNYAAGHFVAGTDQ